MAKPSEHQKTLAHQKVLDLAIRHHAAGRLVEAEGTYHQILKTNPNHPDALHLLGVIAHQEGENDRAVDLITKALTIKPEFAEAHSNLGTSLRQLGRLDDAVIHLHKAIELKSDYAGAHNSLGNVFRELGRLDEAVASCQKALAIKPDYAEAHSNLGLVHEELGKLEEAAGNYQKALEIKPSSADTHENLGTVFLKLERLNDAIICYQKCIEILPNHNIAHSNLGVALHNLGRQEEAISSFQTAVNITPRYHVAQNNLGAALREVGRPNEAFTCLQKAIELKPNYTDAHHNLGNTLRDLGQLDGAVVHLHKAIELKPDWAEAHSDLGSLLNELGQVEAAFHCQRRAVALNPQNDFIWACFAASIGTISFNSVDDDLLHDLCILLEKPTVGPNEIVEPIISALRQLPEFAKLLRWANNEDFDNSNCGKVAKQLSSIPLLLRTMELSIIPDLEVEKLFTALRRSMLLGPKRRQSADNKNSLPFFTALALHCFTNEYVFQETTEETAAVDILIEEIATLVKFGQGIPPVLLATLAAYRPLCRLPWAKDLLKREWPKDLERLITQQIREPTDEIFLQKQIPSLTPIQNTVSISVREQYEENPYPRWIRTGLQNKGRAIGAVLQSPPLRLDLGDYNSPKSPEILVAGCGTGRNAIAIASRFSNAHVLAVDLSLNSLSYAQRKTMELGLSNVEFAQADILELNNFGRQFDLIECSGVLHHLDNPLAGWRILANLLVPGGLMKIGIYSEMARQQFISWRSQIAEMGYTASPEDIRRYRQDLIANVKDGELRLANLCEFLDFFSLSMCRDMMFHVREHHFTIPQIGIALNDLGLTFLGFELTDQTVKRRFEELHPELAVPSLLSFWHQFESEHPDTFKGMYRFWVQKKLSGNTHKNALT